jgi:hypothetical protein
VKEDEEHPAGKMLVDSNPLANPSSYKSDAQLRAAKKKEDARIEAIKPPLPPGFDEDDVVAGNAALIEAANNAGGFQIFGGGNIVVSGSGDTWIISDTPPNPVPAVIEDDDDDESSTHPWRVSLFDDGTGTGGFVATILEGLIYDGLLSVTKITPTLFTDGVVSDSLVCLEYNYSTGAIQSIIVQEFNYEPSTDDGLDPPTILTTVQPIAKIVNVDGVLTVEQIARNNFALTSACINGKILKVLRPL